jgi:predicted nucleic acid-binding Zn ribbon protein
VSPHAPRRPQVANPYDLSTWRDGAAPSLDQPEPGVGKGRTERAPAAPVRGERSHGGDPRDGGIPGGELRDEDRALVFDPPDLPSSHDPFELARRTVNRSRAAARDRGLYPISAKTQARDVRDRSARAPGYSGARPDPRDPQGIEQVLRRVLGDLGWNAGMSAGRVLEEWPQIVGDRIAAHCHPVSFDEGVLVVSASSSAWAAQLRMLTPQLITTIEEHVGTHVISELKVTGPAAAERTWKKGRRTVTWRGPRDTYG